jgi:hypothetical protein
VGVPVAIQKGVQLGMEKVRHHSSDTQGQQHHASGGRHSCAAWGEQLLSGRTPSTAKELGISKALSGPPPLHTLHLHT